MHHLQGRQYGIGAGACSLWVYAYAVRSRRKLAYPNRATNVLQLQAWGKALCVDGQAASHNTHLSNGVDRSRRSLNTQKVYYQLDQDSVKSSKPDDKNTENYVIIYINSTY